MKNQVQTAMPLSTKLQSSAKPVPQQRVVFGPTGNRARVWEECRRKSEILKKPQAQQRPKKPAVKATVSEMQRAVVTNNLSVDSSCSSDSNFSYSSASSTTTTSSVSSDKLASPRRNLKRTGLRAVKVVPDGGISPKKDAPVKRCDWITPQSSKSYVMHLRKQSLSVRFSFRDGRIW